MTTSTVNTIEQPSCFRNGRNEGAADISRGYLLKNGAAYEGVALSTSTGDIPAGVAVETMEGSTNGVITRSRQIGGVAMAISGSAIAIGDKITTDSSGRGIPATTAAQAIWGVARTATSAANAQFEIDLDLRGMSGTGMVQAVKMEIDHTDLSDADTSQSFALVSLPANAILLAYDCNLTEQYVKSSQTFTADLGYATALDTYVADVDIDNATPQHFQAAIGKTTTAARDLLLTIATNTGTLESVTSGNIVFTLYYMLCGTAVEVAAA